MDTFDYQALINVDIVRLRDGAARVRSMIATLTPQAIEIGEIIKRARDELPHGMFGLWCSEALLIERRLAQAYMRLADAARNYGRQQIGKLPLTAAHYLARPSTPETVKQAILERASAGQPITAGSVRELIRKTHEGHAGGSDRANVQDEASGLSVMLVRVLDTAEIGRLARFLLAASAADTRRLAEGLRVPTPVAGRISPRRGSAGFGFGMT